MASTTKYRLSPGGVYGRFENGIDVTYKPGDIIECTPEQAAGASLKGRLTPVDDDQLARETALQQVKATLEQKLTPSPVPSTAQPAPPPRAVGDWGFILSMPAADVIMRVRDTNDVEQLKAMAEVEKLNTSPKGGRRSVLNDISKRRRQLALEKAREARKAKKADEAASEVSDEGDDEAEADNE